MIFDHDSFEELNLLLQFNDATHDSGIKVHSHARPEVIQACRNLYANSLVDQPDGGYLTDAGIEALGHAQALAGLLEVRKAT